MKKLTHKFVEFIPDALEEGALYISLTYGTASHRCCCGCGREVVTPLTPTDWKLIFDGETVSLYPFIGNWNFPCRSHYWIWNSCVEWAGDWSDRRISAALDKDRFQKAKYYGQVKKDDSGCNVKSRRTRRAKLLVKTWEAMAARLRLSFMNIVRLHHCRRILFGAVFSSALGLSAHMKTDLRLHRVVAA